MQWFLLIALATGLCAAQSSSSVSPGSSSFPTAPVVSRCSASEFTLLAGVAISITGAPSVEQSAIVGVAPGSILYFPDASDQVVLDNDNAAAVQAKSDAANAKAQLDEFFCTQTLATGDDLPDILERNQVYCFQTTDVTLAPLSGQATRTFQVPWSAQTDYEPLVIGVAGTLTIAPGVQMQMTSGISSSSAFTENSPCNIFWDIGGSLTISNDIVSSGTSLYGSFFVVNDINVGCGPIIHGQLLSMDGSIFVNGACQSSSSSSTSNTILTSLLYQTCMQPQQRGTNCSGSSSSSSSTAVGPSSSSTGTGHGLGLSSSGSHNASSPALAPTPPHSGIPTWHTGVVIAFGLGLPAAVSIVIVSAYYSTLAGVSNAV